MSDADARDPAAQTLRDAVHRTGESLLALLRTRAELAALEFAEERDRARDRLLMVMVAAVAATFALLALTGLVVAYFWDTHRLAAIAAVAAFYALVTALAIWRLKTRWPPQPPFAATLAELERDREWLASKLGRKA
ncbi:MAG TPA: phage holin family protein [Burkholderiaceae bacterium]|nr:phage holin family protein [Burkholderiaceae bacterium]